MTEPGARLEPGPGAAVYRAEAVRARVRAALHAAPPAGRDDPGTPVGGDHDLNRDQPLSSFFDRPPRPAAVLVPIFARPEGATVLLTRRTDGLATHPGQIAFPGGKIEPDDAGPLAAALREAHEEIGLAESRVEPLGFLDLYRTGTGFRIVPAVALVDPACELRLDPHEVAASFEVPLSFLMSPENHRRHSMMWRGRMRRYHAMPYGEHFIWGATAGILRNLYDRVFR